jgi:hypothetical protein
MSDVAGFLCPTGEVAAALARQRALTAALGRDGVAVARPAQMADAFRWRHLALVAEGVLTALNHYIGQDGGSRGARAYLDARGEVVPVTRTGTAERYRFRRERPALRAHKLVLMRRGDGFAVEERALRQHEDLARIFFEKNWGNYLTGAHRVAGFRHQ